MRKSGSMKREELERLMKRMGFEGVKSFADELEVHQATVYRWLNGDCIIPDTTARLIRMLAREKVTA